MWLGAKPNRYNIEKPSVKLAKRDHKVLGQSFSSDTATTTPLPPYIYYLYNHNCLESTENLCTYPVDIRKLPSKLLEKKNPYLVYHPFASRIAVTLSGIDSHRLSKTSPSIS